MLQNRWLKHTAPATANNEQLSTLNRVGEAFMRPPTKQPDYENRAAEKCF